METNPPIQFPNYPAPQGIPIADRKTVSILTKMTRMLMKPKTLRSTKTRGKRKKKSPFY